MPVAFLAGACETPLQQAARALARQAGWTAGFGTGHRRGRGPLQQLLAEPRLLRAVLLPVMFVVLRLFTHSVLVPAIRNLGAPVSAVLGHGACNGVSYAGLNAKSSSRASSLAAGGAADQLIDVSSGSESVMGQGSLLSRFVSWYLSGVVLIVAWAWGVLKGQVTRRLCAGAAALCDSGWLLPAADCAALFGFESAS